MTSPLLTGPKFFTLTFRFNLLFTLKILMPLQTLKF